MPTAAPDSPFTATGRTLNWGVVATGSIARRVTPQIAALEDAVIHAVSSRDQARAAEFAAEFGCERAYGDQTGVTGYQRLAADPDVDVVYVTTPHGQHHQVAKALLEAGKHVLVEKAFTINAAEAEDLIATARGRGVFLMEAVWTRFLPVYRRALAILKSGELGRVEYVQADLGFVAARDPRTRLWEPVAGGGALLDLAVYPLCWVLGALGFPSTIRASGRLNDEGVDELAALALAYPSGAQAQVTVTFVSQAARTARICCTEGVLETGAPLTRPEGLSVSAPGSSRFEPFPIIAQPYAYQAREVTRCVQAGLAQSEIMPLADTLATMRLFDEARRQLGVRYPNDAG